MMMKQIFKIRLNAFLSIEINVIASWIFDISHNFFEKNFAKPQNQEFIFTIHLTQIR